ncbi:hypothetical protein [Pseudofrankia sp. BMG5.37]|uniref:hypothetical protein n=1 Tax=Pseudofrankia sp. BMG5.37 TaxID=3050035 RepID=UPI002893C9EB|nr:hypothetical protein [Pseudofrankia sp. BMG5.37]MDT3438355.1 hypothetical protein [Pseudofrankia sp. BMG5.37]
MTDTAATGAPLSFALARGGRGRVVEASAAAQRLLDVYVGTGQRRAQVALDRARPSGGGAYVVEWERIFGSRLGPDLHLERVGATPDGPTYRLRLATEDAEATS